jgi:hypothetical protein
LLPATLRAELNLADPRTRWATSEVAQVSLRAELPAASNLFLFKTNLAWPEQLKNLEFHAATTITNATAWKLTLDTLRLTNHWRTPLLRTELAARMGEGGLDGVADLQTAERRLDFKSGGVLPLEKLLAVLGTNTQRMLAGHTSEGLPRFKRGA